MPRPVLRVVTAFLCAFGVLGAQKADQQAVQDFEIEGGGLFQCQCPAHACPCQTNGAPTHGTCYAADVAHIKKGHYGKVKLDGLSIALVGNLVDTKPEHLFATLYLDQKASLEQREALTSMLQYMNDDYVAAPGEPAVPIRRISTVPFSFSESDDKTIYAVTIPGILEGKAVMRRNSDGSPVSTITAMDSWSNVVDNADNVTFRYHDRTTAQAWDESGDYANVKDFHLTRKMYEDRQMLGQHGDMSGAWTREQREIIRRQGLKEK